MQAIGYDAIAAHEASLTDHALARLGALEGVHILGRAQDRGGVVSFTLDKRARARRGDAAGPPGHRGARRPPLRRAADAPLRSGKHRAGQLRHLHDARGNRLSGRYAGAGAGVLRLMSDTTFDDLRDLLPGSDPGSRPPAAPRRPPGRVRRDRQGRQPDVRRPRPGLGEIRARRQHRRDRLRGARLRDQRRLGRPDGRNGRRAAARPTPRALFAAFREMARTGACPHCDAALEPSRWNGWQPLAGVHEYPSRVKCATLPWHALIGGAGRRARQQRRR